MMTRNEIADKYKWCLEDIYPTVEAWEADYVKAQRLCDQFAAMKGVVASLGSAPAADLGGSAGLLASATDLGGSNPGETLFGIIEIQEELHVVAEQLYVYARMRRDEDNGISENQGRASRAQALLSSVGAATSFLAPEILSLDEELVKGWIRDKAPMYMQYFEELFRQKAHVLSDKEEELLAMAMEMESGAKNVFTMFNNADLKFCEVMDAQGNMIELTKGNYVNFLESPDVRVRKDAFEAMYKAYGSFKNTIAAAFSANIKGNIFFANTRKYGSCIEKSLDEDFVPIAVYDKLIEAVNNSLTSLDSYLKLRKKCLGVEKLHMYDLYTPLLPENNEKLTYDQAVESVIQGLSVLGEEYTELLKTGFSSHWVDVYETRGKTGGAYSWGCFTSHPFVLLNFQGKINDMFTIAHEMGHALHTYFSNKTQPYVYSAYKIFVAEVASTVNEILLMKSLLKQTTDEKAEAYLLNHYLEEFRGTVFRQTMFAEFEKTVHEKAEAGEPLTAECLSALYYSLNERFFGRQVEVDKEIELEWSRIPHFYNSFYVYKYATGFSAAVAIVKMILEEGKPAVDRYLEFLAGGGSDYPLELLKKVGVDLTSTKPVNDALAEFGATVERLEELLG